MKANTNIVKVREKKQVYPYRIELIEKHQALN